MVNSKFLGKVKLPHRKLTAEMEAITMPPPSEVLIPLSQHIGAPATAVVKAGDEVKVGQKIAEATGKVSSPIFASVSGNVVKIEDYLLSSGKFVPAIRIASDGLMTPYENISAPDVHDFDSFIEAVKESGVVGLGGAGFPTAVKLEALAGGKIDHVILNGAECEPYVTSDTRAMIDDAEWIKKGIALISEYAPTLPKFIIGIERNKPECIESMKNTFEDNENVSVVSLIEKYPQGGEKIIIYNTTRRIVGEGMLPADVGVLVINVSTLACIAKYVETGMPLVSRTVTIDGSAIKEPKNIIAPIGTSIGEIIEFCGGFSAECGKLLFGGPMMGVTAYSLEAPITKTTGVIVAMNKKDSILGVETACIRCGKCIDACPLNLYAAEYSNALKIEDKDDRIAKLEKYKVMLCMECGSCAYYCPAFRPLVQNSRFAKNELRAHYAHMATLKK